MTADRTWLEVTPSLTRAEIDALLANSESAFTRSHAALASAPLMPELVEDAAGVAQDCLNMWNDVLDLSIHRLWHNGG